MSDNTLGISDERRTIGIRRRESDSGDSLRPFATRIGLLDNPVRDYDWGSPSAIAQLLGRPNPGGRPQAELWMGAHPSAPSEIVRDGRRVSLLDVIDADPDAVLGPAVARRFHRRLPFLFKILAAERPLSIQAHPSRENAAEGFRRENEDGIPLDAAHRNYRDDNHKPEILCALTPFWALHGFRPAPEILQSLAGLGCARLDARLEPLRRDPGPAGLRDFFADVMTLDDEERRRLVDEVVAASGGREADPAFSWLRKLSELHPGDVGVLGPLLLNVVRIEPGEAMYLPARRLHAYLQGMGVELMANSDNVLRGGLTNKHIDVPELLEVLEFHEGAATVWLAEERRRGEREFRTPAEEFRLSSIELARGEPLESGRERSVEIMLCVRGAATVTDTGTNESLELERGGSVLVPAAVSAYRLAGAARIFKASVPL